MRKITFVILLICLSVIGKSEVSLPSDKELYANNESFFNSRIHSTTTDFNENISNRSSQGGCSMCGKGSSNGMCSSCSYVTGSSLGSGSDRDVFISSGIFILFLFSSFYLIYTMIRFRARRNKR